MAISPEIKQHIANITKPIEQIIFNVAKKHTDEMVLSALQSIIENPGKRLRSTILLLCANIISELNETIITEKQREYLHLFAVSLELIHNASLLHDDVIDEAETRRGKPTINRIIGNRNAILIGDLVISEALVLMSKTNIISSIATMAEASKKLALGEIKQNAAIGNHAITLQQYYEIIELKTGSLFVAATTIAADITGGTDMQKSHMSQIGLEVGKVFQITDDIIDYFSPQATTGKKQYIDFMEKKITLPLILLLKSASAAEMMEIKQATEDPNTKSLSIVLEKMSKYNIEGKCRAMAAEKIEQLSQIGKTFTNSTSADYLQELLHYLINRIM